jgi:DNA-binding response OmpR family regulator
LAYDRENYHATKKKYRILIVDDDNDVTTTFMAGLPMYGFCVDFFNDPKESIRAFKADTYDILILDIRMPIMNGFELYRELEKIDNKPKVCFITAFPVYYESLKEFLPGKKMHCFIKKPIEVRDLASQLRTELSK